MIYQVAILNKVTGQVHKESVEADNYPDAVKDAMISLDKKLEPPTHLVAEKRKQAPKL